MSVNFLIVMPTHNEEHYLRFSLESLLRQSHKGFKLVVVNDGSTDSSAKITQNFSDRDSRVQLINLPSSSHQPGAKVVRTFYKGLESQDLDAYEVVCKFDADIIFPENYLSALAQQYEKAPRAGMVSGLVRIASRDFEPEKAFEFSAQDERWEFEAISSKEHVRGPIKSYRVSCFNAMGGLRETLGWDNIDSMLAKKAGFEVTTLKDLWVKHLRPTANRYEDQKATKLGIYFYNIGLSLPLAIISTLKASRAKGSVRSVFLTLQSFLSQSGPRKLSLEELRFIRRLRWKEVFAKFKL